MDFSQFSACPIWVMVLSLVIWGILWFIIFDHNPLQAICFALGFTVISIGSWVKFGNIVWIIPAVTIGILSFALMMSEEEKVFDFLKNLIWPALLLAYGMFGFLELLSPGAYSEMTDTKFEFLIFWVLIIGVYIGCSIYVYFGKNAKEQTQPKRSPTVIKVPYTRTGSVAQSIPSTTPKPKAIPKPKPKPVVKINPKINTGFSVPYKFSSTPYSSPIKLQNVHYYYHGTSQESAWEIWESNLWKSDISPARIWMSNKFSVALSYAKHYGNGFILYLAVDGSIDMHDDGDGKYHIKTDEAQGNEKFYHLDGVEIVKIYDIDKNEIVRRI